MRRCFLTILLLLAGLGPSVRPVAAAAAGAHPGLPFHHRPVTRAPHAPRLPSAGSGPMTASAPQVSNQAAAGFPGTSQAQDVAAFGGDQRVEPPDDSIAAGPAATLEVVNSSAWAYTTGGAILGSFDLNTTLLTDSEQIAGYTVSDPRAIYDTSTGRWFLSCVAYAAGPAASGVSDSRLRLAVSQGSSPLGPWYRFTPRASAAGSGILYDQPRLGVGSDKVVVTDDDYNASGNFAGEGVLVLAKPPMLSAIAPASELVTRLASANSYFGLVPATTLQPSSSLVLAQNATDNSGTSWFLVVETLSGSVGSIAVSEAVGSIGLMQQPPNPQQTAMTGDIDNRLITVDQRGSLIWVTANDGCQPPPGIATHDCARFTEATTSAAILQDLEYSGQNTDFFYPAAAFSASGDMAGVMSASSPTTSPSVLWVHQAAGAINQFDAGILVTGSGPYTGTRWGDYSGAAGDPANPSGVRVVGEYATTPSGSPGTSNWGTFVGNIGQGPLARYYGSNGHWVTDGSVPDTMVGGNPGHEEMPIGTLRPIQDPGTHALYSCQAGTVHFVSLSSGCEGQTVLDTEGFAADTNVSETTVPGYTTQIFRCRVNGSNDHFVSFSSGCEGTVSEGPLGFVLAESPLFRGFGGSGDHWSEAGRFSSSYHVELALGWLPTTGGSGRAPLYSCRTGSDMFSSLSPTCEGRSQLGINGFLSQTQVAGTAPLYRCFTGSEHFDTQSSACEGIGRSFEVRLGYIQTAP
jgi:hypothetical protein